MPASTIAVSSLQDRHREGKTGDQFRKLVGPILHVVLAVSLGSWWLKRRGRHLTVYLALSKVAASAAPLRKHYERTRQGTMAKPTVGVVMGSKSDWETMQHCVSTSFCGISSIAMVSGRVCFAALFLVRFLTFLWLALLSFPPVLALMWLPHVGVIHVGARLIASITLDTGE